MAGKPRKLPIGYVAANEAARILGVDEWTLSSWAKRGELPYIMVGGYRAFSFRDLIPAAARHRERVSRIRSAIAREAHRKRSVAADEPRTGMAAGAGGGTSSRGAA